MFFGVAWVLVLIDIINVKETAVPAAADAEHAEDVQIVPVAGGEKATEKSGWRLFWAFCAIFPPTFGLVVFTAIRYHGHAYAAPNNINPQIVFCGGICSAILLAFLGLLYYWKAFTSAAPQTADLYALGVLLAAVIGGVLSTDNNLSLTVIVLYALYGSIAVVLFRLAVTPATKHLLFLK